ncbi:hypothetical protein QBC40DRAFT_349917 [Triangularia verruculosa]|uniref:RING-type E3 ubiquitin transferase n=1 Tax=Triangularia verruculosa TaxID=2587418 RepID=A0AAN7ATR3_9PEZI|nr:hypothetical protein QBC40DRAFT_349917 [Triangularia verruculosa]
MADISPPPEPVAPTSDSKNPMSSNINSQILQPTLAEVQTSDSDENSCVICLETITCPSIAIPCAHTGFDFLCLISWLQQRSFCPLCRTNVTEVRSPNPNSHRETVYTVTPSAAELHEQAAPEIESDVPARHNRPRERHNPGPVALSADSGLRDFVRQVVSRVVDDRAFERRRYIYRHNLYSLHIGSSPYTSYAPSIPSPQILSSTPHLLSKARLFLRRELQVFFPLSTSASSSVLSTSQNPEFLLEYVISILKSVDFQSESGAADAYNLLKDYMIFPENGEDRTNLFLHELKTWMRWRGEPSGSVSLETWDRGVQYPSPRNVDNRRGANGAEREERGNNWQDETGSHWRPDPSGLIFNGTRYGWNNARVHDYMSGYRPLSRSDFY